MEIDLYRSIKCEDCKNIFIIPGSTPVVKIECPKCKSKNWDKHEPLKSK